LSEGKKLSPDEEKLKIIWEKDYLTAAPYLILVFKQLYSIQQDGTKKMHYYNEMSVAIAAGILLTAIHVCTSSLSLYLNFLKIFSFRHNNFCVTVCRISVPDEHSDELWTRNPRDSKPTHKRKIGSARPSWLPCG
jgi:hypothetical protein